MTSIIALATRFASMEGLKTRYDQPCGAFHLPYINASFHGALIHRIYETNAPAPAGTVEFGRYATRIDCFATGWDIGRMERVIPRMKNGMEHLRGPPFILHSLEDAHVSSLTIGHPKLDGETSVDLLNMCLRHVKGLRHLTFQSIKIESLAYGGYGLVWSLRTISSLQTLIMEDVRLHEFPNIKSVPSLHLIRLKNVFLRKTDAELDLSQLDHPITLELFSVVPVVKGEVHTLRIDSDRRKTEHITVLNELCFVGMCHGDVPLDIPIIRMVDVYHIPTLKGDRTHQTLIIERAQNFGSDFVEEAFHKVIMDYGTRLLYEQNKPRSSETAELFAALDSLDRRVRVLEAKDEIVNIRSILAKRRILMADPVVAPKVIPKTLRRRLKTVNQRCLRALPGTVRRR